jgi:hypothetical protein
MDMLTTHAAAEAPPPVGRSPGDELHALLAEIEIEYQRAARIFIAPIPPAKLQQGRHVCRERAAHLPLGEALPYLRRMVVEFRNVADGASELRDPVGVSNRLAAFSDVLRDPNAMHRGAAEMFAARGAQQQGAEGVAQARSLLHQLQAKGLILDTGPGETLRARPAALLTDDERKKVADCKPFLLLLLNDAAVF